MSQRWRAVGTIMSDLTSPRFKPMTSRSTDKQITARPSSRNAIDWSSNLCDELYTAGFSLVFLAFYFEFALANIIKLFYWFAANSSQKSVNDYNIIVLIFDMSSSGVVIIIQKSTLEYVFFIFRVDTLSYSAVLHLKFFILNLRSTTYC